MKGYFITLDSLDNLCSLMLDACCRRFDALLINRFTTRISSDRMQASSSEDLRFHPSRSSPARLNHTSPLSSHRQSFTESLRGHPPSPRATRQPSFSQAQLQELLNHPPTAGTADPTFSGRDWQTIGVGELCDPADLRWVEFDSGVEDATNVSNLCSFVSARDLALTYATASH